LLFIYNCHTESVTVAGYSWKTNQWGLAIDTVTAFELVKPDGAVVTVTEASDSKLFFGLKVCLFALTFRRVRLTLNSLRVVSTISCVPFRTPRALSFYPQYLNAGNRNQVYNEDLPTNSSLGMFCTNAASRFRFQILYRVVLSQLPLRSSQLYRQLQPPSLPALLIQKQLLSLPTILSSVR